jgi:hypothetical protein
MSISTPQPGSGKSRPTAEAKPAVRTRPKPGARPSGTPAFGSAGGGGKGPSGPVKVNKATNWGPILLFGIVGLVAVLIVAFASYQVWVNGLGWKHKAKGIEGIQVFDRDKLSRNHKWGTVTYPQSPPVGGDHNFNWQRCLGDIYDAPIANEHAVHALEHGAVWITYRPDLAKDQLEILKTKVTTNGEYMMMSPYPGLDKPISLQAWGYQLKLDNANDKRVDEFIKDLRQEAGPEQATCSSGSYITATGTTPHDMGSPAPSASAAGSGSAAPSSAPSTPAATPSK